MSPAGAEIGVSVTAAFQGAPAVAGDALGDFVVAWQRQNPTTGGWDVFARQAGIAGSPGTTDRIVDVNGYFQ